MMEPKFIELHDGSEPLSINVELVEWFADGTISMTNCEHRVLESYDEIKQLIKESGILIHRADPRLNTERELTFAELREMIGEPVWNSNLLRWELVKRADDLYITTCSTGQYDSHYDEGDLIKTPLYRMRRD